MHVSESPNAQAKAGAEAAVDADSPQYRYTADLAGRIEADWQQRWDALGTFHVPNPVGSLAPTDGSAVPADKMFVQDMFPYPSGDGLHVGHPLGYIATDVYARYFRMTGRNVLHALGFDAFGLPAEQYAVQTGTHPRTRTEANIVNFRRQLGRLGLGHDSRRSFATTDVDFYKWTQWIFLQIYNAWFDPAASKARPISELIAEFDSGARALEGKEWSALSAGERADVLDSYRLVYRSDSMVNWCPGLGTVLANEEVTSDGRSERGNFPVFRKRLRQWMMRITAYSDRLLEDLDVLDWPDKVKAMQRNWIGRSTGASVLFAAGDADIEVFTTRPDTLFGASYLVLAPEHDLVDPLVTASGPTMSIRGGPTEPRPPPRRWRPTAPRSPRSRTWNARRTRPKPVCSPARTRPIRSTARRCRSSSPTTCWPATAPAPSWRCPVTTSGTGSSRRRSGCLWWKLSREATFRNPPIPATGSWSTPTISNGLSVADAKAAVTAAVGRRGPRPGPRRIQAAGLAFRPPAVLG